MKQYQLVICEKPNAKNRYWAYYSPADAPPRYAVGKDIFFGDTVAEVIRKANKNKPTDGEIVFTYLDRAK